jgi:hypothetical protein
VVRLVLAVTQFERVEEEYMVEWLSWIFPNLMGLIQLTGSQGSTILFLWSPSRQGEGAHFRLVHRGTSSPII